MPDDIKHIHVNSVDEKLEAIEEALNVGGRRSSSAKLQSWLAFVLAAASMLFSLGQWYYKVEAMDTKIKQMEQDLARKDVIAGQLQMLDYKITTMSEGARRTEDKMDQVIKYLK